MTPRGPWSRHARRAAGRPAAGLAFALASGCSLLLNIEEASRTGPCSSDNDCPVSELCVVQMCHDSCNSDHDCRSGDTCTTTVNGRLACLSADASGREAGKPTVEAGGSRAEASVRETGASLPDVVGESIGSCSACAQGLACVENACRALLWSTPQSTNAEEPQPATLADRLYRPVDENQLYAQRVRVTYRGLLVRLGMLVSTNQPPASFRLGLYGDNQGYPLHPLLEPGAQVSATGTESGRQEIAVSPPVHLDVGNYWITFVSQSSAFVFQSPDGQIDTAKAPVPSVGDPWLDPFPSVSSPPILTQDNAVILYAVVALDPS